MPKKGDMAPAVDLMDKLHQQLMTVRARLQHHGDDRGEELMDAAFQTLAELRGSDGGHRSSSACRSTSLPSRMPVVPEAMCALDMRKDKVSHTLDLLLECTWLFEAHAVQLQIAVANLEQMKETPLMDDDSVSIGAFKSVYEVVVGSGYRTTCAIERISHKWLMIGIQDVLVLTGMRSIGTFDKDAFTEWLNVHFSRSKDIHARLGNSRYQLFFNDGQTKKATTTSKRVRTRRSGMDRRSHPLPVPRQAGRDVYIEL